LAYTTHSFCQHAATAAERRGVGQVLLLAVQAQQPSVEAALKHRQELAAEQPAQRAHRQEEARPAAHLMAFLHSL
jgi:hypothetical protein